MQVAELNCSPSSQVGSGRKTTIPGMPRGIGGEHPPRPTSRAPCSTANVWGVSAHSARNNFFERFPNHGHTSAGEVKRQDPHSALTAARNQGLISGRPPNIVSTTLRNVLCCHQYLSTRKFLAVPGLLVTKSQSLKFQQYCCIY